MATKVKYNLHGWPVYYDTAQGLKEVDPVFAAVKQYDDFTQNARNFETTTNGWAVIPAADGSKDESAGVNGGICTIVSHSTDNDTAALAGSLSWYGSQCACFEARVATHNASASSLWIGFTDTTGLAETTGPSALAVATWTTTAVDGAWMQYDADATNKFVHCMGVKNNTDATAVNTAILPVADTYNYYRVMLGDNGTSTTAYFYIDGVLVATIADILTRTTALAPAVFVGARDGNAKTAYIDYMRVWQKRA
jgi:hypothetical protein